MSGRAGEARIFRQNSGGAPSWLSASSINGGDGVLVFPGLCNSVSSTTRRVETLAVVFLSIFTKASGHDRVRGVGGLEMVLRIREPSLKATS
jgi:hypothetical protein